MIVVPGAVSIVKQLSLPSIVPVHEILDDLSTNEYVPKEAELSSYTFFKVGKSEIGSKFVG